MLGSKQSSTPVNGNRNTDLHGITTVETVSPKLETSRILPWIRVCNAVTYCHSLAVSTSLFCQVLILLYKKFAKLDSRQDVRVTGIQDSQGSDSEQSTASGTQLVVTTLEVVDLSLGQHSVVLQLGLSQHWGVTSDDNQLSLTGSQGLDSGLVAQAVLTGLDNQGQLSVDVLRSLTLWGLQLLVWRFGHLRDGTTTVVVFV